MPGRYIRGRDTTDSSELFPSKPDRDSVLVQSVHPVGILRFDDPFQEAILQDYVPAGRHLFALQPGEYSEAISFIGMYHVRPVLQSMSHEHKGVRKSQ